MTCTCYFSRSQGPAEFQIMNFQWITNPSIVTIRTNVTGLPKYLLMNSDSILELAQREILLLHPAPTVSLSKKLHVHEVTN